MAKGIIIELQGNSGKIKGADGRVYKFNRRALVEGDISHAKKGQQVTFEPESDRADSVRLLNEFVELKKPVPPPVQPSAPPATAAAPPAPAAHEPQIKPQAGQTAPQQTGPAKYHFLNPYNFVRPIYQDRPPNHVLGQCTPPPHDRYVGLTGRLTARVKAVTPLFVSDSHAIVRIAGGKEHASYRFFEYEGQPALPASSLRGMVRSVFETVTNSCFVMLDDKKLSKHASEDATKLVPARVEEVSGKLRLRLLPGTNEVYADGLPRNTPQYAAWLHRYWPMRPSGTLRNDPINERTRLFKASRARGTEVNLSGLDHGQACYALVEQRIHAMPRIIFWDVLQVSEDQHKLKKSNPQQKIVQGWLCLNNQNIEAKHSERFFFHASEGPGKPIYAELPQKVIEDYEALIKDYQERHQRDVEKRVKAEQPLDEPQSSKDAGFSRFIYLKKARNLKDGDLVYVKLTGTNSRWRAVYIAPVSVPRVGHDDPIGQLLPHYLHRCPDYKTLCPACRTFGWTYQPAPGEKVDEDKRVAYAGRVRLSHAAPVAGTIQQFDKEISLAILGSPKPTKTQFYLLDNQGRPGAGVSYNQRQAQLRGRKFYRHHGHTPSRHAEGYEYERATDAAHPGKDDQNRTVRGVVKPGAEFEFSLDFENLAPLELGALLWSLEMEAGMQHRLGYAKPLGFGSVRVEVTGLEVINWAERLASLEPEAGWREVLNKKPELVGNFKAEMQKLYGAPFAGLVGEMKAILTEHPDKLPVHYPRPETEPDPEGKNFKWFQEHKEAVLGLADNDAGLAK